MTVAASRAAAASMERQHAHAASLVMGPPEQALSQPRVVFYCLTRKFVDNERDCSAEAGDILYYTLAVGHHTGMIDCFDEALSCDVACFESVISLLPEGEARYKMEGIVRSGEITIEEGHVPMLEAAFGSSAICASGNDDVTSWVNTFLELLDRVKRTSAVYLIGRLRS